MGIILIAGFVLAVSGVLCLSLVRPSEDEKKREDEEQLKWIEEYNARKCK